MAATHAVKLKRELAQVPITAVAFYRDPATSVLYVLASEDTDLVVYRASSRGSNEETTTEYDVQRPVARVRILSAQPIHGIRVHQPTDSRTPSASRLLIWGGSSVAILSIADLDLSGSSSGSSSSSRSHASTKRVARLRAPDWIYDGAVSPADPNLAVLVTAHNEVVTVRFDEVSRTAALSSELVSPSRPMLYAANVCWTTAAAAAAANEVLVAAGTVFGDILIWKYKFGVDTGETKPKMLYSLSGHEGSIFGVHMSPLMDVPDGSAPVRLLASCSDDRTIRIWNITESDTDYDTKEADKAAVEAAPGVASDTGFRCAPVYGEDGTHGRADVSPVATAMGHASRIWGVKFGLPDVSTLTDAERQTWSEDGLLSVYSFGEDATTQRWSLDVAAALQQKSSASASASSKLTHKRTYALHDGKHLWSRNILCDVDNGIATTHVVAGGADSKITLVKDTMGGGTVNDETYNSAETWEIQDLIPPATGQSTAAAGKRQKEIIGRYDFVTPDAILAVSNAGRVLLGLFTGKHAAWEELAVEDEATRGDMANVYALKTVSHGGALLGSVTGGVYYFGLRDRRITKVASLAGRVVEMNALSKTFADAAGDAEAIVHLHRDATSVYLTLDRETGAVKSQEQITGLDARFVAISAARVDELLIIGSRHGWISVLQRDEAAAGGAYRPILDLPPASGDAVTAILPLPASADAPAGSRTKYVLTTSRDGKYRIFQLDVDEAAGAARMTLLHETAPPFGPWIEGGWLTAGGGGEDAHPELILYGFRSKDLVVWNETRREELATMDCGGAHRTFRLAWDERAPAAGAGRLRFAFTRTSKLSVHSRRGVAYELVRLGQHGREIRSLAATREGEGRRRYVATGAEDTTIRLWEHCQDDKDKEKKHSRMQYMAYMKRHVVGLQKVQWMGDEYLFSSGGNEELFAWRVRTLDSAYAGRIAVVCEGVFADKSPMEDLRIMDFDVSRDDEGEMLVTLAFSNSALKTYRYSAEAGFVLVCQGMYTGACLTQARHLDIGGAGGGGLHVVTASTDGHVAVWQGARSISSSNYDGQQNLGRYELRQTLRVHQSSIKSLDMARLASNGRRGYYGILTGGDDNALAWTLLKRAAAAAVPGAEAAEDDVTGPITFRAELVTVVRRAHAAAITGIALLNNEKSGEEEVRCVSVSNDQWVKVWRMRYEDDGAERRRGEMQLLGEAYSGVADAGDVVVLDEKTEEEEGVVNFRRVMVAGVGLEVWRLE